MRKLIEYFIRYHVAVNVIIIAFAIFGIVGAKSLKSSFFPLTDSKNISISIAYPGASPQEVEEGIVLKIEDNLKGLEGVDRVTSTSRENSGTINVEIEKGRDIDFMLLEVKNAVDRVPTFPTGMEPLIVSKLESIRQTISFAISGENIPLATLKNVGRQIENDLRAIDGISQIEVTGYPQEEIEIAVNENNLLAYGISFTEVAQAVGNANILVTGGNIKTDAEEYLIRANNRSYYGDELSNLIVRADPSGSTIRLKDVAIIRDRFSETPNASYFNGNLSVNTTITSTNTEDLVSSAEKVKDYAFVKANLNNKNSIVIDARSAGRFNGTAPEPREGLRSGSIPNSINIPFGDVLDNGKFKTKEELKTIFSKINSENKELIYSCGSGLTACIILLASELVLPNTTSVYDGSWTEWAQIEK